MNDSIVLVKYTDAIQRRLPPAKSKLVGVSPCRYCICVQDSGQCDVVRRKGFENSAHQITCNDGESVYRDIAHDPALIPFSYIGEVRA